MITDDEMVLKLNNKFTIAAIQTKAKKLNIERPRIVFPWTENENNIIKTFYSTKTLDEIQELIPNHSRGAIINQAMTLNVTNGIFYTEEELKYLKEHWKIKTDEEIAQKLGRTISSVACKRTSLGLLRQQHGTEKESYYSLEHYLRTNNVKWKKESMANCNYKCILSGKRFDVIHHLYSFNLIFQDTINKYNFEIKEVSDYSNEELHLISDAFLAEQALHPLGVCITEEIHRHFHSIYGYGFNTPEQWNEFVKLYQ